MTNHYGVDVNKYEPITGVVANNSIEFLGDVLCEGSSIDLDWQEHTKECKGQCQDCFCNHENGKCDCWDEKAHEYEPDDCCHDSCGPQEQGTVLIGSWKKDADGKYEPDKTGEYAAIVSEIYTQVVWSRHVKKNVALCSPCFPGQADLGGNQGDFSAYALPPDVMGEES